MYEIKSNEPPPQQRGKWPFKYMKIGDHIQINDALDWDRATRAAHALGRYNGFKFSVKWERKAIDSDTGETRGIGKIWRRLKYER